MDVNIRETVQIVKRWGEPASESIQWSGLCPQCGPLPGTCWNADRALLASLLHQESEHNADLGALS